MNGLIRWSNCLGIVLRSKACLNARISHQSLLIDPRIMQIKKPEMQNVNKSRTPTANTPLSL